MKEGEPQPHKEIDIIRNERDFWSGHSFEDDCPWEINSDSKNDQDLPSRIYEYIDYYEAKYKIPRLLSNSYLDIWSLVGILERSDKKIQKKNRQISNEIRAFLSTGINIKKTFGKGEIFKPDDYPEGTIVMYLDASSSISRSETLEMEYAGMIERSDDKNQIRSFWSYSVVHSKPHDQLVARIIKDDVEIGQVNHHRLIISEDTKAEYMEQTTSLSLLRFGHPTKEELPAKTLKNLNPKPNLG